MLEQIILIKPIAQDSGYDLVGGNFFLCALIRDRSYCRGLLFKGTIIRAVCRGRLGARQNFETHAELNQHGLQLLIGFSVSNQFGL